MTTEQWFAGIIMYQRCSKPDGCNLIESLSIEIEYFKRASKSIKKKLQT